MSDAVKCCDCAHINNGSCDRPVARHFHCGSNSYRSRLHVLAALERNRTKTLTGRVTCGPDARYFEPKLPDFPIQGKQGTVIIDEAAAFPRVHDTLADSDGDDGA